MFVNITFLNLVNWNLVLLVVVKFGNPVILRFQCGGEQLNHFIGTLHWGTVIFGSSSAGWICEVSAKKVGLNMQGQLEVGPLHTGDNHVLKKKADIPAASNWGGACALARLAPRSQQAASLVFVLLYIRL